jgi:outer membrane immunogenic protein
MIHYQSEIRGAFMHRGILGLAAVLCVLASGGKAVVAADLPVKARPMPVAAAYNWTGFYVGAHAGYGWADKDWRAPFDPPFNAGSHTATGWLAGLQLGGNYQIGNWVLGLEGQYSWADINGDHISRLDLADRLGTQVSWLATVTGRVGYAFDRTLIYGKGGVAWIRDKYTKVDLGILEGLAHETRTGWVAGVGVEYAFLNNWSVKLEYNYMDFGTNRLSLINPTGGAPDIFDIKQNLQTVTLGANYRF